MSPADAAPFYSSLAADPILGEMVALFVDEMPARTACLKARFDAQDWDGLKRAAHQMKGAVGSYGFDQLTLYSAALEDAVVRRAPPEEIARALDELVRQCGRVTADRPAQAAG